MVPVERRLPTEWSVRDREFYYSVSAGALRKTTQGCLLAKCFRACELSDFITFMEDWGLMEPTFKLNMLAKAGNCVYDRFVDELTKLPDSATLAIVFHGTPKTNIPSILVEGLDPSRRRCQARGPGEYFGKNPGTALRYCRGGGKMLAFLVVLPDPRTCTSVPHHSFIDGGLGGARRHFRLDGSVVVVSNGCHHLPLGIMSFSHTTPSSVSRLRILESNILSATSKVASFKQQLAAATIKANVIQTLISGRVDIAGEIYGGNRTSLDTIAKSEIAMHAYRQMDRDIVDYYFPNLPPPMTLAELTTRKASNEATLKIALDAAEELLQKLLDDRVRTELSYVGESYKRKMCKDLEPQWAQYNSKLKHARAE